MDANVLQYLQNIQDILTAILIFNISFFIYGVYKIISSWFGFILDY